MIVKGYKSGIDYRQKSNSLLFKNIWLNVSAFNTVEWDTPSHITNLVVSENTFLDNKKVFFEALVILNCKHLVWLISEKKSLRNIRHFIEELDFSDINSVQIYLKFQDFLYSGQFGELIIPNKIVKKAVVYNSPFNKNFENKIFFIKDVLSPTYNKSIDGFLVNFELFHESQEHHTYFNRKLYIGSNGEIKNAPECPETFGNMQDLDNPEQLKEIIQTPEFQKYWYAHKEITDVCKDCEFRHMCVDNRLPYQRTKSEWYHKTECNYNPYIAKWKGEEGYRTLSECGVRSDENSFTIDHEKIAKINEELWGE